MDRSGWPIAPVLALTPFEMPETAGRPVFSLGGKQGRNFAAERAEAGANVYEAVRVHANALRTARQARW